MKLGPLPGPRIPGLNEEVEQATPTIRPPAQQTQAEGGGFGDMFSQLLGGSQSGASGGGVPDVAAPSNQSMSQLLGSAGSAVPELGGIGDMLGGLGQQQAESGPGGPAPATGIMGAVNQMTGGAGPAQEEQQSGGLLSRFFGGVGGFFGRLFNR